MQSDLSQIGLPVQWSYGILLYHTEEDKVLMIQRRDTIEYIEIVKGRVSSDHLELLEVYINRLTIQEREKLMTQSFDTIWSDLWCNHKHKNYHKQYWSSYQKFQQVRPYIKRFDAQFEEREYILPRGRTLASDETELHTAQRECEEETGIKSKEYKVTEHVLKECYMGSDNVLYGSKYYVCTTSTQVICQPSISEVKGCHWIPVDHLLDYIRTYRHFTRHIFIEFLKSIYPLIHETTISTLEEETST